MLHWLATIWAEAGGPALFRYVTARSAFAFLSAAVIGIAAGRPIIHALYRAGMRSKERTYGDINTASKAGTPVMGGLIILVAGVGSALLWCDLTNLCVQVLLAACLWFSAVGFYDDYHKVRGESADAGLSRVGKYGSQLGFGLLLAGVLYHPELTPFPAGEAGLVYLPFLKEAVVDLRLLWIPFAMLVITYSTNAVNFADGMDGLAVVSSLFVLLVFGIFAFVMGNAFLADYLLFPHTAVSAEITVFCSALIGGSLAFLWFNAHPAEIFMGDTGSLMLGGAFGTTALLLKQEALLLLAGGVFLAEFLSTLIQEWFGLSRGRRIFFRAPFHHSLQHRGMAETKIVVRLWIVAAILAAISLVSLKVR